MKKTKFSRPSLDVLPTNAKKEIRVVNDNRIIHNLPEATVQKLKELQQQLR